MLGVRPLAGLDPPAGALQRPRRQQGARLMIAWEYGYIYVVHTVGPAPAVCLVVDVSGKPRLLDGCHGLMRSANVVGAEGWLVSGQGEKSACTPAVNELVRGVEGAIAGDTMMCYFMRREAGVV
jgi:hypothetical protein